MNMNMDYGLFQQQSMKLVMTNELRQAITILQYSVLDLGQYLHEQQLENPLMELKDNLMKEELERSKQDIMMPVYEGKSRFGFDQDEEYSPLDQVSERQEGLQDHLLNQIRFLKLDSGLRRIVTYFALSVDENGYLKTPVHELAEELREPKHLVEAGIHILQSLEPIGVGASSLKDCLLIQLQRMEVRDLLAEKIVSNYLDILAKKQFKTVAKAEGVDVSEVQYVFDFIQTLNPKPGSTFHNEPPKYVIPDVTVKKVNGEYIVFLNEDHLPELTMNSRYEALLKNSETEVSEYIHRKYEQFQWIKRSVEQRQQTLLKVTKAIVDYQQNFLEHGPSHLRPLTLKTIAEAIDVHESTVSRATTKKYLQTPKGLLELKYFFSSNVGNDSGEASSSERVKIYLKRLVDEENKQKPLSDQKLASALKEQGIHVSRRTVAKYRDEMHILSSSQRKRYS
ncbi:RNA polymerase factor sigma-54 [Evansella tamaricis]|uniref:RNA polymerase factor sigma-54 n=1 Tax=Evansella tamaricis TaxID=2069301 RepID=A0ABS6JFX6_9BACI|nr:RNA polymerase factor sigma-54 [Evansella tamaricis]MBU9712119.1 RNA polymerase factor sigma-54 [Evansella tamaricis]